MSVRACFLHRLSVALCLIVLLWANAAAGQKQPLAPHDDLFLNFYKDPRPERLVGYFDDIRKLPGSKSWEGYPPSVGFLAVVFRAHRDWIDRIIPDQPNAREVEALAAALQLAGISQGRMI